MLFISYFGIWIDVKMNNCDINSQVPIVTQPDTMNLAKNATLSSLSEN